MADGLSILGNAQDKSLNKTFEYSMSKTKLMKNMASIGHDNCFLPSIIESLSDFMRKGSKA